MRKKNDQTDTFVLPNTQNRIAIQGICGAFHEIATRRYFGDAADLNIIETETFEDLIAITQEGKFADGALMAIENTIAGNLMDNYNLLYNSSLYIKGELYLRIVQNLIVTPGVKLEDITEVYSHPVALAQCVHFFKQYPHIKLIEASDTALSVKMIKVKGMFHAAAIGSSLAAEMYKMEILVASIEDYKKNYTRFLVLAPQEKVLQNNRSFHSMENTARGAKCSMVFTLKHKVGSLHKVLGALVAHNADLTMIQSIPIPDEPWHYRFFVGFTFDNYEHYQFIMNALANLTESMKVFGVYEVGKYYEF